MSKSSKRDSALFGRLEREATVAMAKALAWQRYDTILEVSGLVAQALFAAVNKYPDTAPTIRIVNDKIRHDLTRMRDEAYKEFTSK